MSQGDPKTVKEKEQDSAEPHNQSHRSRQERYKRLKDAWRKTSLPNKLLVLIQFVTLLAVTAYSVETYFLWSISDRSAETAIAAVNESKRQFDILQKNRDADAKENSRRFDLASEASKRQAEASRYQSASDAAASLKLARKSLDDSQRALEVTQRARLGIESIQDFPIAVTDAPVLFTASIKNSGALSATQVHGATRVQIIFAKDHPLGAETADIASMAVIPGGAIQTLNLTQPTMTAEIVNALKGGVTRFYVVGDFQYLDGFGKTRHLRFCAVHESFYRKDGTKWSACSFGNEVD